MNGWTLERRQRQSELIRRWKPWEKTTGPKTEEGKKRVSHNAYKHGMRSAEVRELERLMSDMKRAERAARKLVR